MNEDQVTWVIMGAKTLRVESRSKLNTAPMTARSGDERHVSRGGCDRNVDEGGKQSWVPRFERGVHCAPCGA